MELTKEQQEFDDLIRQVAAANGMSYEEVAARVRQANAAMENAKLSSEELIAIFAPKKLPNGAPVRLCALQDHPDYDPICPKVGVKFNGEVRKNDVFSYDAEEGWIRVHIRDNKGNWKRSRGRFITVKLTGTVEPFIKG